MDEPEGGQRLHQAISAALEAASQAGQLRGSVHKALESTLARLDEKLKSDSTAIHYRVTTAPDQCLVVLHSSDPVALEMITSFMHEAGATKPGSAEVWMLPLGGLPVNRWMRALRRVITAERRSQGETDASALPVRLTVVWAHQGELVMATVE